MIEILTEWGLLSIKKVEPDPLTGHPEWKVYSENAGPIGECDCTCFFKTERDAVESIEKGWPQDHVTCCLRPRTPAK